MVRLKRGNEALTSELKKVKKKSAEDVRKMQVSLLEMHFHLKLFLAENQFLLSVLITPKWKVLRS